jgi:arsenite methyltransferase
METAEKIKEIVKEKYGTIALQSKTVNETSCCGSGCGCTTMDYTVMADDYSRLDGYNPDADLGLGCGLPTAFADIREGHTVVDLGSGAGNDVFVARKLVGAIGKVIGLDMTEAMIEKAVANNKKLGFENVEFRYGDIENMPIADESADVVVSNCVLNLVPDKPKAFSEIYRILKPGGHFCISDIVLDGELPERLLHAAAMYTGCVAGALQRKEYLEIIQQSGFKKTEVAKEKKVILPDEILLNYISAEELNEFKASGTTVLSVTIKGTK